MSHGKYATADYKVGNIQPQGKGSKAVGTNQNKPQVDYDPEVRPTRLPAKTRPQADYKVGNR